MGTWSTGIFDNDTASDVRDDWLNGIANNEPVNELTSRLLKEYEESLASVDGDPEFWTGLAAIQSRTGYLDEAVRDKALALIRSGEAARQWVEENSKLAPKRQKALDALAERLTGPQPRPKRAASRRAGCVSL